MRSILSIAVGGAAVAVTVAALAGGASAADKPAAPALRFTHQVGAISALHDSRRSADAKEVAAFMSSMPTSRSNESIDTGPVRSEVNSDDFVVLQDDAAGRLSATNSRRGDLCFSYSVYERASVQPIAGGCIQAFNKGVALTTIGTESGTTVIGFTDDRVAYVVVDGKKIGVSGNSFVTSVGADYHGPVNVVFDDGSQWMTELPA